MRSKKFESLDITSITPQEEKDLKKNIEILEKNIDILEKDVIRLEG